MYHRIFLTALLAGALAGVWVFAAHMITTTPLIRQAEVYENGTPVHSHDSGTTHDSAADHEKTVSDAEEWVPADGLERSAYSLLADLVTSMGFAFLLVGAIALSGQDVDLRRGLIWGLCGFAAFMVGPAFGLAPELPGMQAADLQARQVWWVGTAIATAGGLALIFLANQGALKLAGAFLLVLPHLIGAPDPVVNSSNLPAVLASEFAVKALVVSALYWLLLGGLSGYFYRRFEGN